MMWWRRRALEAPTTPLERLQERASAYIDGELTEAERAAFEAELVSSEVAREQVDDLRQVRLALTGIGTVRAPRSFALLAPPAPVRTGPRRLEWATRAGTGVAALLFVVALTNSSSAGDTPVVLTTAQRESASSAAPASKNDSATTGVVVAPAGAPAGAQDRAGLAPAAPTSTPIASTTPRPAVATASATPGTSAPGAAAPVGAIPSAGTPAFAPTTAPATPSSTPASGSATENRPSSAAAATALAPVAPAGAPSTAPGAAPTPRLLGAPSASATPQTATALATATATVAAFAETAPRTVPASGADPFRPDPRDASPVFARPTPDASTVIENPMYVPAPTPVAAQPAAATAPAGTEAGVPSSDRTGRIAAALGALTVLLGGISVAQFAVRRRQSR